ncbi:MAG: trigger factor [Puniceicoccales bacterium]|nr:trigger factor [Puniceicoccales bacterium]
MKSEIKSINSVRKEVVVVIEKAVVQREENSVLQSFARDIKIPGFRKGKIPLTLVKSRYGKELDQEIDKTVASKTFDNVVKENNWDVFSLVKFDVRDMPDGEKELNFVVDLKPIFELLDYKNIEVEQPEISVGDEDINGAIEQIRNHHADYKEVKRPIQRGDFVRLQYVGTQEDGTKATELIPHAPTWAEQNNAWEKAGKEAENSPGIEAIVEGIIAMEVDGEKDVEMEFPADFAVPELQGKKIKYHVKVFEIREKILPELGDAFFEKLKTKDLDELKTRLSMDLEGRKLQELRFEQRESIVQKMIDSVSFEIPESAVKYEQILIIRSLMERQIHEGMTPEMIKNNEGKLFEDTKELASDRAKVNFILEKIAEKEKISVTDNEMNQMILQEASMLRISPDQLIAEIRDNRERIQELRRRAVFGKTLDFVLLSNLKEDNPKRESDLEEANSERESKAAAVPRKDSVAAINIE